jgi:hypothetical protein
VSATDARAALAALVNERRDEVMPLRTETVLELVAELQGRGLHPSLRDVLDVVTGGDRRAGIFGPPRLMIDFITAYFAGKDAARLLDPWAMSGVLAEEVGQPLSAAVTAITPNRDQAAIAAAVTPGMEWLVGEPRQVVAELERDFDAIVSAPPFSLPPGRQQFEFDGEVVEVADHQERLLILASLARLAPNGEAIFLVTDGFFERDAWRALPRLGYTASAVIALPRRSLAPVTSISASLLIVGRVPHEQLFIAQLEEGDADVILDNLRERRPGATPELGRLVDAAAFRGVAAYTGSERVHAWALRVGLTPVALEEICDAINPYSRREGAFPEATNAVFLSLLGAARVAAATNPALLRTKPENCVQLVLNPERALAEYVTGFFNSERGQALRATLAGGVSIPRIPRPGLGGLTIYLPDLATQTEIVRLDDTTRNLHSQLSYIAAELWESPQDVAELRQELSGFVADEGAWIEALPFPLASILWRYYAEIKPRERVEHLLHFFEALSEFAVALLLSGLSSDRETFAQYRGDWLPRRTSLQRATFGTWTTLQNSLGQAIRDLIAEEDDRQLVLDLFRTTRSTLIESLAEQRLQAVLDASRQRRNDWSGHGGAADEREWRRRLSVLESDLSSVRETLGGAFRGYQLLRPGASRLRDGVHHYSAHSLMGSRREFRVIPIETVTPMDEARIYLLDSDTRTPLEIVPFFQIRPGPETEEDACYFYNRIQDDGRVRLVSYHFEREAEFAAAAPELVSLIESLSADR